MTSSEAPRFYFDEHLPPAASVALRLQGIDAIDVRDAGLLSAGDIEHLAFALRENRVMVTCDRDFTRLAAQGAAHAGIILFVHIPTIGAIVRATELVHGAMSGEEMRGRLEFM